MGKLIFRGPGAMPALTACAVDLGDPGSLSFLLCYPFASISLFVHLHLSIYSSMSFKTDNDLLHLPESTNSNAL